MAWPTSAYPTSLDGHRTDRQNNVDDVVAADINGVYDCIDHIEVYLGVSGSAVDTTITYKLTNAASNNPGHNHTLWKAATAIDANDNTLSQVVLKDYGEILNAIGSIGGGAQTIDLTLGNVVSGTVDTAGTTFTFSNPTATGKACSFTLILTNGGSQTVNWPASVKWSGGSAPSLTASGVDILVFVTLNAGTAWYGMVAGINMS